MVEIHLNHVAVIVCGVLFFILGGLWYSPLLFAKSWVALSGLNMEELKKNPSAMPYVIALVCEFVAAYGIACVVAAVGAKTFMDGATMGLFTGVAFALTSGGMNYAFEHKPFKLFLINFGYPTAGYVIMGGILAVWR